MADCLHSYGSGQLDYQDGYGGFYEGNWDIRRINVEDGTIKTLKIYCVDHATGDVLGEYFDEMVFTGTNTFEAYIYDGTENVYVCISQTLIPLRDLINRSDETNQRGRISSALFIWKDGTEEYRSAVSLTFQRPGFLIPSLMRPPSVPHPLPIN